MKTFVFLSLSLMAFGLTGCAPAKSPILEGEIKLCQLWDKPRPRQGELGSSSSTTFTSGRIQIYDHFICVIETNGVKHVAPHDWFSNIQFK